jgi:hypothetical protein
MKIEQTECSDMLVYKIQMPVNDPEKKNATFRRGRKFEIKNKESSRKNAHKHSCVCLFIMSSNCTACVHALLPFSLAANVKVLLYDYQSWTQKEEDGEK